MSTEGNNAAPAAAPAAPATPQQQAEAVTADASNRAIVAKNPTGFETLALRNQIDPKSPATPGATKRTLLDELAAPQVLAQAKPQPAKRPAVPKARVMTVAAPAKRDCVSVIIGGRSTQECF